MDISQWLRETELPPQPERFAEKDKRPTLVPPEEDNAHRPAKRRRKHGRYRSLDSSILQAAFPIHESGAETDNVARRSSSGDGTSHTQSTTSKELSSQHSEAETASDKYERKPRRKTRADRYQLKPAKEKKSKESKGRTGRHAHEERKSKKRKRKRTARDNPASGWVMGFHAKNVAKDRLTLKGPLNSGLFRKGRASSPVRGRGLPDLVFSEMRFLQKKPDQPQESTTEQVTKKKHKKTTKAADQDEISAYFAPKRPALADRDNNVQAGTHAPVKPRRLNDDHDLHQHQTRSNALVHPSIELPGKAFLGFGSRGARPATSASYYSWAQTSERLNSRGQDLQQPSASHEDLGISSVSAPRRHSSTHDPSTMPPPDSARSILPLASHALPPVFPREMTTIDVGQLVLPPARIMRLSTNQNDGAQSKCDPRGCYNKSLRGGSDQGCGTSKDVETEKEQTTARGPSRQVQEKQSVSGDTVHKGSLSAPNGPDAELKSSSPLTKLLKACATTLNASAVAVPQPQQPSLEQRTFTQPPVQSFRAEQDLSHAPLETCIPEEDAGGRFYPGFQAYHQLPVESEGPRYIDREHCSAMNSHGNIDWEPGIAQGRDEYDLNTYGDDEYPEQWGLQNEDMVTQEAAATVQDQVPCDGDAYDEAGEGDTNDLIFAHFWRPHKLY